MRGQVSVEQEMDVFQHALILSERHRDGNMDDLDAKKGLFQIGLGGW